MIHSMDITNINYRVINWPNHTCYVELRDQHDKKHKYDVWGHDVDVMFFCFGREVFHLNDEGWDIQECVSIKVKHND